MIKKWLLGLMTFTLVAGCATTDKRLQQVENELTEEPTVEIMRARAGSGSSGTIVVSDPVFTNDFTFGTGMREIESIVWSYPAASNVESSISIVRGDFTNIIYKVTLSGSSTTHTWLPEARLFINAGDKVVYGNDNGADWQLIMNYR